MFIILCKVVNKSSKINTLLFYLHKNLYTLHLSERNSKNKLKKIIKNIKIFFELRKLRSKLVSKINNKSYVGSDITVEEPLSKEEIMEIQKFLELTKKKLKSSSEKKWRKILENAEMEYDEIEEVENLFRE